MASSSSSMGVMLFGIIAFFQLMLFFQTEQTSKFQHELDVIFQKSQKALFTSSSSSSYGWNPNNPLEIPHGQPPNLPSVRVEQEGHVDDKRAIYGGKGDKKHLGGFTLLDLDGVSPSVWEHMITKFGVKSFIDVGCGKGVSTRWFYEHNVDTLCVEGSHDAVTQSYLPPDRVVEHDFSRGPWWPEKTYDAAWSVEFLEHVSRHFQFNYMTVFRKSALIFASSSRWGGWHHVEVHEADWWIRKFESYGLKYSEELTQEVRAVARAEANQLYTTGNVSFAAPNGEKFRGFHIFATMKVFINPAVAALPQHNHLFPQDGCFEKYNEKGVDYPPVTRKCNRDLETPLIDEYEPLQVTPEMHKRWSDLIAAKLKEAEAAGVKK